MQKTKIIIALFCFAQPLTAAAVVTSSVNAQYCIGGTCTSVTPRVTEPNGDSLDVGYTLLAQPGATGITVNAHAVQAYGYFLGADTVTLDDMYTVLILGGTGVEAVSWFNYTDCDGNIPRVMCSLSFPAPTVFTYGVAFNVALHEVLRVDFTDSPATVGWLDFRISPFISGNPQATVTIQDDPPAAPVAAPEPSYFLPFALLAAVALRRRLTAR